MTTISLVPFVRLLWEVRVAGRVLGGVMEAPDCDGALEQVSRVLMEHMCEHHGLTMRDFQAGHVFVFRRVE